MRTGLTAPRMHASRMGIALLFVLLLLLASCGGSSATSTPIAAKPTPAPAAATSAASPSAAGTTAPTSAPSVPTAAGSAATAPAASSVAGATTASTTTTTASTGADPRGAAPAKRGGGGTLHLLFWQAPTVLNVHQASSGNGKDQQAARIATEPLAVTSANALTPDVPVLVKEIPSTQNGELAADGASVTWKLKDGVK